MKPIKLKPEYNLEGVSNVVLKDEVTFVGIDGTEVSPWDNQAAAIKQLLEMLGE